MSGYQLYQVTISEDLDGGWTASVPDLDLDVSGGSEQQVITAVREAISQLTNLPVFGFAIQVAPIPTVL